MYISGSQSQTTGAGAIKGHPHYEKDTFPELIKIYYRVSVKGRQVKNPELETSPKGVRFRLKCLSENLSDRHKGGKVSVRVFAPFHHRGEAERRKEYRVI